MGWISVKDRLPEEIGHYIVYYKSTKYYYIDLLFFNSNNCWCGDCYIEKGVTHWMPLPKPPEVEE